MHMRNDHRRTLINQLVEALRKIKKQGKEFNMERTIAYMAQEHGTARRTAMDYIKCAKEIVKDD